MDSYKALDCSLLPIYEPVWVFVSLKKASVDMSAGTVLQILFLSSLCQSKHDVTGRHFQEYLLSQNLIFISGLIKQ